LYNKDNAPEIAINTCLKCAKVNLYVFSQRDKRKANTTALSLDMLEENSSDGYYLPDSKQARLLDTTLYDLIQTYFLRKQYLTAFILDLILNDNVFSISKNGAEFSIKKLKQRLMSLDKDYCKGFAITYGISCSSIENAIKYIQPNGLDRNIDRVLTTLKHNKELYGWLHNAY